MKPETALFIKVIVDAHFRKVQDKILEEFLDVNPEEITTESLLKNALQHGVFENGGIFEDYKANILEPAGKLEKELSPGAQIIPFPIPMRRK